MGKNTLQDLFLEWKVKTSFCFQPETVDYLGINIDAGAQTAGKFKVYYKNSCSGAKSHPLIEFLKNKNMVRYLTMVEDRMDVDRKRFDIGLKNRNDENMETLFVWLRENVDFFSKYEADIRQLSQMKVTEQEGFGAAGFYFLGFISIQDQIQLLKCHYFHRICENPDVLHKNMRFADGYYLNYLKNSGVEAFVILTEIMEDILKKCGGHLWMSGVDYSQKGAEKYKIYLKNPEHIYDGLRSVLEGRKDSEGLSEKIDGVEEWNERNTEYDCEGFAVCMGTDQKLSLNFYFTL